MSGTRKVELAPRMGTAATPIGRIPIICSVDLDHLQGKSVAQTEPGLANKKHYYAGTTNGLHTITHHSWVMMSRAGGSLRNLHDEFTTGSGTAELPSAMVFGDFNGMAIDYASDPEKVVVIGVAQNEIMAEPDREHATSDPGALTVAIGGITTVQCITSERLRVGDWFGVRAPTPWDDHILTKWPPSTPNSYAPNFAFDRYADKVVPVMYRINYQQLVEALHVAMRPGNAAHPDPIRLAVVHPHKDETLTDAYHPWRYFSAADMVLDAGAGAAAAPAAAGAKYGLPDKWEFPEKSIQTRVERDRPRIPASSIPELDIANNIAWLYGEASRGALKADEPAYVCERFAHVLTKTGFDPHILSNRKTLETIAKTALGDPLSQWGANRSVAEAVFSALMVGAVMGTEFAKRVSQQAKGRMTTDAPIGASWPTVNLM